MTDKQIIIDGIDVSKCIYFQQEDDEYTCGAEECNGAIVACRACDNCYYKQLKRSEAKREAIFVTLTDSEKAYRRKEQECEFSNLKIIQLQETLSQYETDLSTKDCIVETCKAQYKELKAENDLAKQLINWILKFFELTDYDWQNDQNEISALIEDYIDDKNSTIDFLSDVNKGLFKTLTKIKEIATENSLAQVGYNPDWDIILHKISECEGNDE